MLSANDKRTPGGPVQLEHPLLLGAGWRLREELLDGLGSERVAVPTPDERHRLAIAEHSFAALVGDENSLGEGVECPAETDGLGARIRDGFDCAVGRTLQEHEHFLEVVRVSLGRVRPEP